VAVLRVPWPRRGLPNRGSALRLPLLDSVRALAALSVLAGHALFTGGATDTDTALAPFAARLDVGVTIFFLLSGFLLYRPFVSARLNDERAPGALAYAWRRALRILPAYWLALAVSAAVLGLAHGVVYFGLLQTYTGEAIGGLPQAWTLCVEVAFYAFLPVWALAVRRLAPAGVRGEVIALGLLAAASILYKVAIVAGAADPAYANGARALLFLPAFLDQFALGMALAVLSASGRSFGRGAGLAWLGAVAAFLVVSLGIGLDGVGGFYEPMSGGQVIARHVLYAAVALGILLPAAFGVGGLVRRLLATRTLTYLGLVSYGIFLWHVPVLQGADRIGLADAVPLHPYVVYGLAGLGGAVVLASLSFHLVERPLLKLKRWVPDRARAPGPEPTAAPAAATAP
jgi:peptidoglycan/LPS O-acetylase OafA/YrhL